MSAPVKTGLPTNKAVLDLLQGLLGRGITVAPGAPVTPTPSRPTAFATYVDPGYGLNAVVLIDTTLAATRLMDRALAIEDAFDRERSDVVNAPRTLDVDLIVVGDRRSDDEHLRLPHPRATERAFVLKPWFDLEPDAEFPDAGPIAELLARIGTDGLTLRDDLTLELE